MVAALKWKSHSQPVLSDVRTRRLVQAAHDGDCETIKALVSEGVNVDAETENGTTALMKAAACGQLPPLRALLDLGAAINKSRPDGFTALILSVFFGHEEIVTELLSRGADLHAKSRNATSAAMWATARGFKTIYLLLLAAEESRANLNFQTRTEQPPARPAPPPLPQPIKIAETKHDDVFESTLTTRQVETVQTRLVETVQPPPIANGWSIHDAISGEGIRRIGPGGPQTRVVSPWEQPLTNVPEFSAFSALLARLGTNWKLAAAIAITVVLLSGLMTAATLRIRHAKAAAVNTRQPVTPASTSSSLTPAPVSEPAVQSENLAPSESTSPIEKTEVAAPASTEKTQIVDSPESQFEPRIVSSISSAPRPLPRPFNAKRRKVSGITILDTNKKEVQEDANRPAAVTFMSKTPAPSPQRSRVTNDLPSQPVAPLAGSTSKKRVIQWP